MHQTNDIRHRAHMLCIAKLVLSANVLLYKKHLLLDNNTLFQIVKYFGWLVLFNVKLKHSNANEIIIDLELHY